MMVYTVKQPSQLTGVSVRTLHYHDHQWLGLKQPTEEFTVALEGTVEPLYSLRRDYGQVWLKPMKSPAEQRPNQLVNPLLVTLSGHDQEQATSPGVLCVL